MVSRGVPPLQRRDATTDDSCAEPCRGKCHQRAAATRNANRGASPARAKALARSACFITGGTRARGADIGRVPAGKPRAAVKGPDPAEAPESIRLSRRSTGTRAASASAFPVAGSARAVADVAPRARGARAARASRRPSRGRWRGADVRPACAPGARVRYAAAAGRPSSKSPHSIAGGSEVRRSGRARREDFSLTPVAVFMVGPGSGLRPALLPFDDMTRQCSQIIPFTVLRQPVRRRVQRATFRAQPGRGRGAGGM